MPERLVFKIDGVLSHALALCYLGGFVIGAYQFANGFKAIEAGMMNFSLALIMVQMGLMMVGGGLGLFWLGTKHNFLELAVIPSVIGGMLTLIAASIVVQVYTPVNETFPYSFGGTTVVLGCWFVFIMSIRWAQINTVRKQVKTSKEFRRKESSTPPPRKEIAAAAKRIIENRGQ